MRISEEKRLIQRLDRLKPWQQVAFATAIAERGFPNYALFAEITEFGDASEVRHALALLWDFVNGQQSAKNFDNLLERLEPNIPELDDFDMYGAYPALDAIVAVYSSVNCAQQPSANEVASVAKLALDSIGKFIKYHEVNDLTGTELYQYIEEHPLHQQQQTFQESLLELLEQSPKQGTEFTRKLRQLAQNNGISHLGISL